MNQVKLHTSCLKLWSLYEFLAHLGVISWDYMDPTGGMTTVEQDEDFVMKHGPIGP